MRMHPPALLRGLAAFIAAAGICAAAHAQIDPLPSWNRGDARTAILDFVACVTNDACPQYVPAPERIAVFDNDGTLWSEQPMYVQLLFVVDRIKALGPQHPDWQTTEPFASVLKGDLKGVAASGEAGIAALVAATHAGMTTDEFDRIVTDWLATARHPTTGRPYTKMVYRPMLELLTFLRANGFKTYIVSGGGTDFMRPWTEKVYEPPSEPVGC